VCTSDTTPGATIHFTTDGTNPTTSSTTYSGTPITVATDFTSQCGALRRTHLFEGRNPNE